MKGLTLGLDLGKSCTGWAILDDTKLVRHGHWRYTKMPAPQMFSAFTGDLELILDVIENYYRADPGTIAFEAAEHQQGKAREAYFTLSTALRVVAYNRNIRVAKVYPGTVKKIMTGNGAADKPEMVAAVNKTFSLDFDDKKTGVDHNVADAIAIGLTAYTLDALGELDYI